MNVKAGKMVLTAGATDGLSPSPEGDQHRFPLPEGGLEGGVSGL